MNSLSWFLYLAEVVDNLSQFISGLGLILLVVGIISLFVYLVQEDDMRYRGTEKTSAMKPYKNIWILGVVVLSFSILIPSKETVYAITVSELGEEVLKSDLAGKAFQGLENWLDDQIGTTEQEEQDE